MFGQMLEEGCETVASIVRRMQSTKQTCAKSTEVLDGFRDFFPKESKNNATSRLAINRDIKITFLRHLRLSLHYRLPSKSPVRIITLENMALLEEYRT